MANSLFLALPPLVQEQLQQGLLERAYHDQLFPQLKYRAETEGNAEQWPLNTGVELVQTRTGVRPVVTKSLIAGQDPTPSNVPREQWVVRLERFGDTTDIHMPTARTVNADLFMDEIKALGLQAGQSIDRLARNTLFKSYNSGHTSATVGAAAPSTTLHVASLNGFVDVVIKSVNAKPAAVSPTYPLPVLIRGVTGTRNVIGITPDDPADLYGPGVLTLDAALGAVVAARAPVRSIYRPEIYRVGGGDSVDALGAGDILTLQSLIDSVNKLRANNVQPCSDGYFHVHMSTYGNSQVFQDPAWQRLFTALPEHPFYKSAQVGAIAGCLIFLNTESPDSVNSGATIATGAGSSVYSPEIGAETINNSGVRVGRAVVLGDGAMYERYLDESSFVSEAGVTGKVGQFEGISASSVSVSTLHTRLVLRAPIDRLQDTVAATWTYSGGFTTPTDLLTGTNARYKRALVIEHALV